MKLSQLLTSLPPPDILKMGLLEHKNALFIFRYEDIAILIDSPFNNYCSLVSPRLYKGIYDNSILQVAIQSHRRIVKHKTKIIQLLAPKGYLLLEP